MMRGLSLRARFWGWVARWTERLSAFAYTQSVAALSRRRRSRVGERTTLNEVDGTLEPPAHWLEHARPRPPEHWLALIREHAPELINEENERGDVPLFPLVEQTEYVDVTPDVIEDGILENDPSILESETRTYGDGKIRQADSPQYHEGVVRNAPSTRLSSPSARIAQVSKGAKSIPKPVIRAGRFADNPPLSIRVERMDSRSPNSAVVEPRVSSMKAVENVPPADANTLKRALGEQVRRETRPTESLAHPHKVVNAVTQRPVGRRAEKPQVIESKSPHHEAITPREAENSDYENVSITERATTSYSDQGDIYAAFTPSRDAIDSESVSRRWVDLPETESGSEDGLTAQRQERLARLEREQRGDRWNG
jgi:hypothetical protein